VHKGSTQTNKGMKKGFKNKGAKKLRVPWSGAPDCPVCHRTVSGAPGPYNLKPATLGFSPARSSIIHRTVRCTSGIIAIQHNGRLQRTPCNATVRAEVRAVVRGAPDSVRCTRTVQSQTSHSRVFASALLYNSPDCPVHQRNNCYPAQRSTATDTL
jgi:hypothetical protein